MSFIRLMDRAGALLDAYAHHPYPSNPSETPYAGSCRRCTTITMASIERLVREVEAAAARISSSPAGSSAARTRRPLAACSQSPAIKAMLINQYQLWLTDHLPK